MAEFVVSQPIPRYLMRQPMGNEHDVDVVPGLRHAAVHSLDLVVSQAIHASVYTVVVAERPTLSEHDRAVIAQALAATRRPQLAFLSESTPDGALADCPEANDPLATAAAVSVVRAVQGFDEADMSISLNGRPYTVAARWDGRNWLCKVG